MKNQCKIIVDKNSMRVKAKISCTETLDELDDILRIRHFYPNDDEMVLIDKDIDVPISSIVIGDKLIDKDSDGIYEIDQTCDFIKTPIIYEHGDKSFSLSFKDKYPKDKIDKLKKNKVKLKKVHENNMTMIKECKSPIYVNKKFYKQERIDFVDKLDEDTILDRITKPFAGIQRLQELALFNALMVGDATIYYDPYYNIHITNIDITEDEEMKINGVHWREYETAGERFDINARYATYNEKYDLKKRRKLKKNRKFL